MEKNFLVGVYEDEVVLLKAVKQIQKKGIHIYEVFTPFPVHHLDHALGYREIEATPWLPFYLDS